MSACLNIVPKIYWLNLIDVKSRGGLTVVRIPTGARDYSLLKRPDMLWGPSSLLLNSYQCSFPEVKRSGLEVDSDPPSSCVVENEWKYSSSPIRLICVCREYCTLDVLNFLLKVVAKIIFKFSGYNYILNSGVLISP